uniref:Uncharacterized protein n=1 Tax=Mesocestoides corti TaxID=53468 RepID=A0A5K3FWN0_MESCO
CLFTSLNSVTLASGSRSPFSQPVARRADPLLPPHSCGYLSRIILIPRSRW